jgi:hypothetical protein
MEELHDIASNYNQKTTTDTGYTERSVDVSNYREVMGQNMSGIERINPHRQNRFKPE